MQRHWVMAIIMASGLLAQAPPPMPPPAPVQVPAPEVKPAEVKPEVPAAPVQTPAPEVKPQAPEAKPFD